jgi:hypothetical protein
MTPSSAQVDLKSQYSEGGSAVRHYSLCILNVRVVTLAQGLILLAGASFLIREGMLFLSFVVSAFGLFFSVVLWALQRSYWVCFDCMLDAVIRLEEYSRPSDLPLGPWASYKVRRKDAYGQLWWRLTVKHGPYWLLALAFAGLILGAAVGLFGLPVGFEVSYPGQDSTQESSVPSVEGDGPATRELPAMKNILELSISDTILAISLIVSLLALWQAVRIYKRQETASTRLAHLPSILAVEGSLANLPEALRFHGIDPKDLEEAGITPQEFAYLLTSFTCGGVWHQIAPPSVKTDYEIDEYRSRMCESEPTRKAWPLVRRLMNTSTFVTLVDSAIRRIEATAGRQRDAASLEQGADGKPKVEASG